MQKKLIFEKVTSLEEVSQRASELLDVLKPGDWLFLDGDLGAGKTFFTMNLCLLYGVSEQTTSPTFSLMNVYKCFHENGLNQILHLDLYRIKHDNEILYLGIENVWTEKSLLISEWPFEISNWEVFFETLGIEKPKNCYLLEIRNLEDSHLGRMFLLSKLEEQEWIF